MEKHTQQLEESDSNLLSVLRGEQGADDATLKRLRMRLLRVLGNKLRDRYSVDDAFIEDCVQEAFVVAVGKLNSFRGESSLFTWLCAIGVRIALSEIRKKRWSDVSLDALNEQTEFDIKSLSEATDTHAERNELLVVLSHLIHTRLTPKQRTALLAELNGMGPEEIAQKLNTTRGAIYKLTHDARRSLLKGLSQQGFILGEQK